MKNILVLMTCMLILTGCPNEKEIKETTDSLLQKKIEAMKAIGSADFSFEGLMKSQDYFFDFSEKVHLMKEDDKVRARIKKMIKTNGADSFCSDFVLPLRTWQELSKYCQGAGPNKCSTDMVEYQMILNKFFDLIGNDLASSLKNNQNCN
ncbi:MAG: hypothetical protein BroJett040_08180 [Oligoflexia bacterium]|nr:MAG: hypothetical protein BroJett040_08180 [Oligoflexia bacterium]